MPVDTTLGFYRLKEVQQIVPLCRTDWYDGIKEGKFPAPIKLGARAVGWRKQDIHDLVARLERGEVQHAAQ